MSLRPSDIRRLERKLARAGVRTDGPRMFVDVPTYEPPPWSTPEQQQALAAKRAMGVTLARAHGSGWPGNPAARVGATDRDPGPLMTWRRRDGESAEAFVARVGRDAETRFRHLPHVWITLYFGTTVEECDRDYAFD